MKGEKQNNFEYRGPGGNGFVALLLIVAGLVGGVVLLGRHLAAASPDAGAVVLLLLWTGIMILCFRGFLLLEPNEARVLLFFGTYRGTYYRTGFRWVNPLLVSKPVSLRSRNLNIEPIKVNDRAGNPILIGLVLVWRIRREGVYQAVFEIDAPSRLPAGRRMEVLEGFARVQSDAALREVAGCYAYDSADGADDPTLRSSGDEINARLEQKLAERLAMAGIEVVEARINYLAYAPEIAAAMLRRQQADAIIAAREKIVEGAVSMVKMALDRLDEEQVVKLDADRRAALVSNLLVVLCADEQARPVLDAGA